MESICCHAMSVTTRSTLSRVDANVIRFIGEESQAAASWGVATAALVGDACVP